MKRISVLIAVLALLIAVVPAQANGLHRSAQAVGLDLSAVSGGGQITVS